MILLLGCIFLIGGLTGCAPELHERLIIRAVGIDTVSDGYSITIRAAVDTEKEISFTESASTVAAALETIARKTGKKPLYSHNALILFGDSCARQGIQGALDFFLRHYDSRPAVNVFLADGTAEEILTVKPDEDVMLSEQIAALAAAEAYSGRTVRADLVTLINGMYGANRSAVLPVLHKGDTLEIQSAGLLQNMQLRTTLDPSATRGFLLLSGRLRAGESVVFNETCGTVTIAADTARCEILFSGTKENPRFTVRAEIEGDISSVTTETRRIESQVFPELEQQFALSLMQDITAYLNTAVYRFGCDAAGLGYAAMCQNTGTVEMDAEAFSSFLQKAVIDLAVSAKIDRVEEEDKPYF